MREDISGVSEASLHESTTLNSGRNTAIETLLEKNEPVAHFYFDPDKHDTLTTEYLLRSYIKQFLRHLYKTQKELPVQVSVAIKRIFGVHVHRTSCNELLQELLVPLLKEFERSFLVVDGLDLCLPHDYKATLNCFSTLLQKTPVNIIICGRDELDVARRFPGSVHIEVTRAKTRGDIALFVKHYIEELSTYDGPISNEASTIARIRDTLIDQAGEMYVQDSVLGSLSAGQSRKTVYLLLNKVLMGTSTNRCPLGHVYH